MLTAIYLIVAISLLLQVHADEATNILENEIDNTTIILSKQENLYEKENILMKPLENATVENIEKFFKAGRGNARVIDGVQNGKVSMNSRRSKQGVVVTQQERAIPTRSPNMEKHYKRWRHLNRRNAMQKKKKQMKKNKRRS